MLKKEFDILYHRFETWLFDYYNYITVIRMYGADNTTGSWQLTTFLQTELLSFVYKANKRVHPDSRLLLPGGICEEDFEQIISTIKTNLS